MSANESFLILSDSLSCLQSIENRKLNHPLILEIIITIHRLIVDGKQIALMWLPSHTDLAGNVSADAAAKAALNLPESLSPVPYSDFYPLVNNYITTSWQRLWSSESGNKLHSIEPNVKETQTYRLPRRDECIIHRLRIGHTYLTHGFLLRKEEPPECTGCKQPLTVEHILLNCLDFNIVRPKYFTCTTLADLFSNVPSRAIVDFIKEIGLYHKVWILLGFCPIMFTFRIVFLLFIIWPYVLKNHFYIYIHDHSFLHVRFILVRTSRLVIFIYCFY